MNLEMNITHQSLINDMQNANLNNDSNSDIINFWKTVKSYFEGFALLIKDTSIFQCAGLMDIGHI